MDDMSEKEKIEATRKLVSYYMASPEAQKDEKLRNVKKKRRKMKRLSK